jgi:ankyrin repeat protein
MAFSSPLANYRYDLFYIAIQEGDIPQIASLISEAPQRVNQHIGGIPPLSWAVNFSQLDVADFLIEQGADIRARNLAGADPKIQDSQKINPARFYANERKFYMWIRRLAKDVPALEKLPCPLHSAVELGDVETFAAFLKKNPKFNLELRDSEKRTFLHITVLTGRLSFIEWTIANLESQQRQQIFECRDKDECTALHYAVYRKSLRLCHALLAFSSKHTRIQEEGLAFAQKNKYSEIVRLFKTPSEQRATLLQAPGASAPPVLAHPPSQVYQADSPTSAPYIQEQDEEKFSQRQPPQRASDPSPSQAPNISAAAAASVAAFSPAVSPVQSDRLVSIHYNPLDPHQKPEDLFYCLLHQGELKTLRKLLGQGIIKKHWINEPLYGSPPLCLALSRGYLDIADYLIELGVNVSLKDSQGKSALFYAAQQGFVSLYKDIRDKLVSLEGLPEQYDKKDRDFFSDSPYRLYLCDFLLTPAKDTFNAIQYTSDTPAMKALFQKWHRCPPPCPSSAPLHIAVECNNMDLCRFLLKDEQGMKRLAWLDEYDRTSIHVAVQAGRFEFIALLKDHFEHLSPHEELNRQVVGKLDNKKWSALHYAVEKRDLALCKILVHMAKDIHIIMDDAKSPCSPLALSLDKGYTEITNFLMKYLFTHLDRRPPNPKGMFILQAQDKQGRTLVHIAVQRGYADCIALLQQRFSKLEFYDECLRQTLILLDAQGWPALYYAVEQNNLSFCQALVEMYNKSSIINYPNDQESPLSLSVKKGYAEITAFFAAYLSEKSGASQIGAAVPNTISSRLYMSSP